MLYLLVMLFAVDAPVARANGTESISGAFARWREQVQVDPRVPDEMKRFVHDGEKLGAEYVESALPALRQRLFDAAAARIGEIERGDHGDFVDVEFPDPGFVLGKKESNLSDVEKKFEDGFVRTEFRAFIPCSGVAPHQALRLYTSTDFRMQISSRTERIWDQGGNNCVKTRKKTFVPAMMSCNRITEIHGDDFSAQHSQVVSNPGGDEYQVVYFKESIKTFVTVPGGLLLHYINFSRSKRVTGIARGLVRGKLEGAQRDAVALLAEELAGGD